MSPRPKKHLPKAIRHGRCRTCRRSAKYLAPIGGVLGIAALMRLTAAVHAEPVTRAHPVACRFWVYGTNTLAVRQFDAPLDGMVSPQAASLATPDDFKLMFR